MKSYSSVTPQIHQSSQYHIIDSKVTHLMENKDHEFSYFAGNLQSQLPPINAINRRPPPQSIAADIQDLMQIFT